MNLIKNILYLLDADERRKFFLLLILFIISALFDVIGIASILPFISIASNPDLIIENKYIFQFYNLINCKSNNEFLLLLGIFVFILFTLSLIVKGLTALFLSRFTYMRECSIGKRLFGSYMIQPYSFFLNINSAEISKNILSEVQRVISDSLLPLLTLISQLIVSIFILFLLFFVDPILAIFCVLFMVTIFAIIFKFLRKTLNKYGKIRVSSNKKRYELVNEAFGSAKELKLNGMQNYYLQNFSDHASKFAVAQTAAHLIANLPRYIFEGIAFGGLLIFIIIKQLSDSNFSSILPIVSLYAFAGYRLMPAIQQVYGSLSQLKFSQGALNALHDEIKKLNDRQLNHECTINIDFNNSILLKNIYFAYPNSEEFTINDVSLEIKSKTTVAFVGQSGSGKTTLLDIILGLLNPIKGTLVIDGLEINSINVSNWQKYIGYVPQQIYLSDQTIANNIAFGLVPELINMDKVKEVAKIANLHEFIINELPKGYDTPVGERGVRLSGGQIQRIGIARALYKEPSILILDEATSALDNITEKAVMDAVAELNHSITIIIVAHRLSTVINCDNIFIFESGKIIGQGIYDDLLRNNYKFKNLANIS